MQNRQQLQVKDYTVHRDINGREAVFKYRWVYGSYTAKDKNVGLMVSIMPIKHENYTDKLHWGDRTLFKELDLALRKLAVKFGGKFLQSNFADLSFKVSSVDQYKQIVFEVSSVMRTLGVVAEPCIDRLTGFPSVEYADSCLQYVLNDRDVTMFELEDYMIQQAKLPIKRYDEALIHTDLPLKSEQVFNKDEDCDGDYFIEALRKDVTLIGQEVETDAKKICQAWDMLTAMQKKCEAAKRPRTQIRTTENTSEEYKNFSSAWM